MVHKGKPRYQTYLGVINKSPLFAYYFPVVSHKHGSPTISEMEAEGFKLVKKNDLDQKRGEKIRMDTVPDIMDENGKPTGEGLVGYKEHRLMRMPIRKYQAWKKEREKDYVGLAAEKIEDMDVELRGQGLEPQGTVTIGRE
uniref:Uncharacterized protein n=1 Tax=viral metagenome TaxID=1070528 RepID=A0A6M3KFZ6_9ZZZZ